MSLNLITVNASLVDPSGDPLSGVEITAELFSPVVYSSLIMPTKEVAVTDDSGNATLLLAPTDLIAGKSNSYSFTLKRCDFTSPVVYYEVAVPSSPTVTTLQILLGWTDSGPTVQMYWTAADPYTATNFWY
jgi:hypothetical protein